MQKHQKPGFATDLDCIFLKMAKTAISLFYWKVT